MSLSVSNATPRRSAFLRSFFPSLAVAAALAASLGVAPAQALNSQGDSPKLDEEEVVFAEEDGLEDTHALEASETQVAELDKRPYLALLPLFCLAALALNVSAHTRHKPRSPPCSPGS